MQGMTSACTHQGWADNCTQRMRKNSLVKWGQLFQELSNSFCAPYLILWPCPITLFSPDWAFAVHINLNCTSSVGPLFYLHPFLNTWTFCSSPFKVLFCACFLWTQLECGESQAGRGETNNLEVLGKGDGLIFAPLCLLWSWLVELSPQVTMCLMSFQLDKLAITQGRWRVFWMG